MRRKTPQEKKALDYTEQIRPDIEAPHGFRKNWPKKKARENRRARHEADTLIRAATTADHQENLTAAAIKFLRKGRAIKKDGIRNLRERVASNRESRRRSKDMRVMVMIKATNDSEGGEMPSEQMLTEMGQYNEELVKAGIMQAGEGLHPSSKGVRVRFSGKDRTVTNGPFGNTEELIAGFWLWNVKSMDQAIEWVKRCPNPMPGESVIEIRPVFEAEDFGAEYTPELREQEERLRAQIESQK